jgi:hypothetical protein
LIPIKIIRKGRRMSLNNVIPFELIEGGLWKTTPVNDTPVIELERWTVVEVTPPGTDRHFVGYNITEGEGRTSSKIVSYNKETKTGTTRSGRKYRLIGESGIDGDALYVFTGWCRINGVESYKDVSDEYK